MTMEPLIMATLFDVMEGGHYLLRGSLTAPGEHRTMLLGHAVTRLQSAVDRIRYAMLGQPRPVEAPEPRQGGGTMLSDVQGAVPPPAGSDTPPAPPRRVQSASEALAAAGITPPNGSDHP